MTINEYLYYSKIIMKENLIASPWANKETKIYNKILKKKPKNKELQKEKEIKNR